MDSHNFCIHNKFSQNLEPDHQFGLESFYFSMASVVEFYSFNQFVSITEVQLKLTQLNKDN